MSTANLHECRQLRARRLLDSSELLNPPENVDLLTAEGLETSRYYAGFAASPWALEAALRLRFEVFNLELGEGLHSSAAEGLDRDDFDAFMSHLVLVDKETNRVVGTYRMQTMKHALRSPAGSYSGREFDLAPISGMFHRATECGRACLATDHRNPRALLQLWLGIGEFMNLFNQQYLFGCCSITSVDPEIGWRALASLKRQKQLHDSVCLKATPEYSCGEIPVDLDDLESLALPKLFRVYLRLGAKVFSEPAIDRDFGTIDFLVLIDAHAVSMSSLRVVV